jgi:hypothetical protein
MISFKTFMENQTIGLGDLGRRINHLYHSQDFGNQIAGAYASSDVTGSEQSNTSSSVGHPLHLPDTDLTIPSTIRSGVITTLELKKTPIYIHLSDGTDLYLTRSQYERVEGGIPAKGKTMTVFFQRRPEDITDMVSKIDKVTVS